MISPVVLHVLPRLESGGVEHSTVELATLISRDNFHKIYAASAGGKLVPKLEEAGVNHVTLSLATKNPFKIIFNGWRLSKLAHQLGIELFHVHSRAPAWSVRIASHLSGIPYISTYHGAYRSSNALKKWYNSAMVRGRGVITISDFIDQLVQQQYSALVPRTFMISPGIDTQDTFNPQRFSRQEIDDQKQQWGIPAAAQVLLSIGRITKKKRFDWVIRALAALQDNSTYLVIAGSDQGRIELSEGLLALAQELGVRDRVILVKDFHNIPLAYAVSDVVLFPTEYEETFGRIVVEAGAMAKPVIASHRGAIPESVTDGETGYLFPYDNFEAFIKCLQTYLALSIEQKHEMAKSARAIVVEKYDSQRMCERVLCCYHEVLM